MQKIEIEHRISKNDFSDAANFLNEARFRQRKKNVLRGLCADIPWKRIQVTKNVLLRGRIHWT